MLVLVREDLDRLLLTADQGRLGPPGGVHRRQHSAGRQRSRWARRALRRAGPGQAGLDGLRPGDLHQRVGQPDRRWVRRPPARAAGSARSARRPPPADWPRLAASAAPASERLAREAQTLVRAEFLRTTLRMALNYGIRSVPASRRRHASSRGWCSTAAAAAATPKARFAYILPNRRSALIQARLRPDLTEPSAIARSRWCARSCGCPPSACAGRAPTRSPAPRCWWPT